MINENIVDFTYLQSLFFLFLCFLFSASSLKTSFFCCFNSYYLLSRTKFGIRAWLLIVLTIKRSICLCLTLDWSKKKRTVLIKKKKLFIGTVHHQRQRFSAAAPQPITAADPSSRRPAHQSHRAIDNSTSTPITANDHNQDTSTRRFIAFNNPQRCSHNRSLSSATQISVTNHQP
jgi:hypothetical protein